MSDEGRAVLVEQFNCLTNSSQEKFDLQGKYLELSSQPEGAIVIWSLDKSWFVEGELYDQENLYQQRKVIAELSPGDFFILPQLCLKGYDCMRGLMRRVFVTSLYLIICWQILKVKICFQL